MPEDVSTKKRTTRSSIREQRGITKDQNADQKINKRGKKRGRKETGKDADQNVDAEYTNIDESIRKKGKKEVTKLLKKQWLVKQLLVVILLRGEKGVDNIAIKMLLLQVY